MHNTELLADYASSLRKLADWELDLELAGQAHILGIARINIANYDADVRTLYQRDYVLAMGRIETVVDELKRRDLP